MALACDLAKVRQAVDALQAFLIARGCAEEERLDCELALVEACNNAIEYATEAGRSKPVLVEAVVNARQIEMRVTDHTAGFEWGLRPKLPASDSETGRGLFLIRRLMEESGYSRGRDENTLVMRKQRKSKGRGLEGRKRAGA